MKLRRLQRSVRKQPGSTSGGVGHLQAPCKPKNAAHRIHIEEEVITNLLNAQPRVEVLQHAIRLHPGVDKHWSTTQPLRHALHPLASSPVHSNSLSNHTLPDRCYRTTSPGYRAYYPLLPLRETYPECSSSKLDLRWARSR